MSKSIDSGEAAEAWGVTSRTVIRWCEAGLIEGAEKIGRGSLPRWVIPANAKKPIVKNGRPYKKP